MHELILIIDFLVKIYWIIKNFFYFYIVFPGVPREFFYPVPPVVRIFLFKP